MTAYPPPVTHYADPTRVPLGHVIAAACEGLRALRQDAYAEALAYTSDHRDYDDRNLRSEIKECVKAVEACIAVLERVKAPRPWLDLADHVRRDLRAIELRVWRRG